VVGVPYGRLFWKAWAGPKPSRRAVVSAKRAEEKEVAAWYEADAAMRRSNDGSLVCRVVEVLLGALKVFHVFIATGKILLRLPSQVA
jgi:hypothetical protein